MLGLREAPPGGASPRMQRRGSLWPGPSHLHWVRGGDPSAPHPGRSARHWEPEQDSGTGGAVGESRWAGGCRELAGGPAGRPGFGHQIRLFPSTFKIPMVVTGDGVTVTICGNHRGEPSLASPSLGLCLSQLRGQAGHPRAPAPPPPGVMTSLRTSPLSPEDGTAPFRPAAPRKSSHTNTHGPGSDAELASPVHTRLKMDRVLRPAPLTAENGASVPLSRTRKLEDVSPDGASWTCSWDRRS